MLMTWPVTLYQNVMMGSEWNQQKNMGRTLLGEAWTAKHPPKKEETSEFKAALGPRSSSNII